MRATPLEMTDDGIPSIRTTVHFRESRCCIKATPFEWGNASVVLMVAGTYNLFLNCIFCTSFETVWKGYDSVFCAMAAAENIKNADRRSLFFMFVFVSVSLQFYAAAGFNVIKVYLEYG